MFETLNKKIYIGEAYIIYQDVGATNLSLSISIYV